MGMSFEDGYKFDTPNGPLIFKELYLKEDEYAALQRVAKHYNLSEHEVLKMLLRREDNYGQASVARIALGIQASTTR